MVMSAVLDLGGGVVTADANSGRGPGAVPVDRADTRLLTSPARGLEPRVFRLLRLFTSRFTTGVCAVTTANECSFRTISG